nr:zinc-finger domain-containing protein [uncultured Sphingomonas sp.]
MSSLSDPEIVRTKHHRVACVGGTDVVAVLGHPRVFYQIDDAVGFVDCGYCDRRFILEGGPADAPRAA